MILSGEALTKKPLISIPFHIVDFGSGVGINILKAPEKPKMVLQDSGFFSEGENVSDFKVENFKKFKNKKVAVFAELFEDYPQLPSSFSEEEENFMKSHVEYKYITIKSFMGCLTSLTFGEIFTYSAGNHNFKPVILPIRNVFNVHLDGEFLFTGNLKLLPKNLEIKMNVNNIASNCKRECVINKGSAKPYVWHRMNGFLDFEDKTNRVPGEFLYFVWGGNLHIIEV